MEVLHTPESSYAPLVVVPTIAIVGRPNVGKSTIFNCLTKTKDALVYDLPGVTRDRLYGEGKLGEKQYHLIDTGGILDSTEQNTVLQNIDETINIQVQSAITEANHILFIVDAKAGLTSADRQIASMLRKFDIEVSLLVNKVDTVNHEIALTEFYALGFENIYGISAAHNRNMRSTIECILEKIKCPELPEDIVAPINEENTDSNVANASNIKISIVGRPNVGKSTLVNRILGDNRVITCDYAGTTRDSIYLPFTRNEQQYTLIDTAGLRKRAKVVDVLEKFSGIKAMQALRTCDVAIIVVDGNIGISDQDMMLVHQAVKYGKSIVLAINKWDKLDPDLKDDIKQKLTYKFNFAKFIQVHFISALHGTNVGNLFKSIDKAYQSASKKLSTSDVSNLLEKATRQHQPPQIQGRRIKLKYANYGGGVPPTIIIHGNQTDHLPDSYKKYLSNFFMSELNLTGTPIRLIFKSGDNPFHGRKNKLTERQLKKRKRLMKFVKKR